VLLIAASENRKGALIPEVVGALIDRQSRALEVFGRGEEEAEEGCYDGF